VGECADGEVVDPGRGDLARTVEGQPAARFQADVARAGQVDGGRGLVEAEVVEQHEPDAGVDRLADLVEGVALDLERDPRGVRRMIARLSELLRYNLEAQDGPEIPLRQELELLGRYLDIMQVRFQGRLDVRQRVADEALEALVPTMVLQPLVENAIRHGVEKLEAGGRIGIEAAPENGELVLRVSDNGPGPASGPREDGGGVGLRNTVARLEQLYGGRGRFTLLPSADGEGTTAEVRLPLRRSHVG